MFQLHLSVRQNMQSCNHPECIHKNIPDVIDKDKWTPLHFACNKGHKEIAWYLVEKLKCNTGKFHTYNIILSDTSLEIVWSLAVPSDSYTQYTHLTIKEATDT